MFPHGTEAVPGATLADAETNIAEFVRDILTDIRLPPHRELHDSDIEVTRLPQFDAEGRFAFAITIPAPPGENLILTVLMPGLSLNHVNFGARGDDRPSAFPRLYLDGNSWLWRHAIGSAAGRISSALRTQG